MQPPRLSVLGSPVRLAAISATGLLDAAPEAVFDRLTQMVAKLVDAPAAVISLVTDDRQFFVSQIGLAEPFLSARGSPLMTSVCRYVVEGGGPLVVEDIRADARMIDVAGVAELGVVAYAGVPLLDGDGALIGTIGAFGPAPRRWSTRDIEWLQFVAATAREELSLRSATREAMGAAIRLREGHELLSVLAAQVPGVIFQFRMFPDGRSCFPYVSPAIADLFEVDPSAMREDAAPLFERIHPDDAPALNDAIMKSWDGLTPFRHEYRVRLPRGGEGWHRAVAQPDRLDDGSLILAGFTMDITADVAERRIRDEMMMQLQHAQKMEAIGTLASGIAHDFNNVLAGILGNVEAARGELTADHRAQEPLDDAFRAARRAKALVAQILAFSRRQPPQRVLTPLQPLLEEVWRLVRATIPTTITMTPLPDDLGVSVLGDPTQLHQVILNLCTNGTAAMRGAVGTLALRTERVEIAEDAGDMIESLPPGPYVRITVSDTGVGMSEVTRRRIFEPFFTTRATGEGTGLGLTMVYAIVKSHDGGVAIHSEVGRGTSVHVYLPEVQVDGQPEHAPTPSVPLHIAREGMPRVVVVDDEEMVGRAAERLLRRLGCTVDVFVRPVDALVWLAEDPRRVDVVLTDLTMPDIDGVHLIESVKRLRSDLPVILSSGLLDESARLRVTAAGAIALLEKPYTLDDLTGALVQAGIVVRDPRVPRDPATDDARPADSPRKTEG